MQETRQKKKKKAQHQAIIVQPEEISQSGQELIEFLQELEAAKKFIEVQVCPKCKGPKVKRVGAQTGDLWGNMGITPPKYECSECGWVGQIFVKVTNRPLTVKDVELIAETLDGREE